MRGSHMRNHTVFVFPGLVCLTQYFTVSLLLTEQNFIVCKSSIFIIHASVDRQLAPIPSICGWSRFEYGLTFSHQIDKIQSYFSSFLFFKIYFVIQDMTYLFPGLLRRCIVFLQDRRFCKYLLVSLCCTLNLKCIC